MYFRSTNFKTRNPKQLSLPRTFCSISKLVYRIFTHEFPRTKSFLYWNVSTPGSKVRRTHRLLPEALGVRWKAGGGPSQSVLRHLREATGYGDPDCLSGRISWLFKQTMTCERRSRFPLRLPDEFLPKWNLKFKQNLKMNNFEQNNDYLVL